MRSKLWLSLFTTAFACSATPIEDDGSTDGAVSDSALLDDAGSSCVPPGTITAVELQEVTAHPPDAPDVSCFPPHPSALSTEGNVAVFDSWAAVDALLREQKGCAAWTGSFEALSARDYAAARLVLVDIGETYDVPKVQVVSLDGDHVIVMLDDGYRCSGVAPPSPVFAFLLPFADGDVSFKSCVPPRQPCMAP